MTPLSPNIPTVDIITISQENLSETDEPEKIKTSFTDFQLLN